MIIPALIWGVPTWLVVVVVFVSCMVALGMFCLVSMASLSDYRAARELGELSRRDVHARAEDRRLEALNTLGRDAESLFPENVAVLPEKPVAPVVAIRGHLGGWRR
jgi:hypothetical protein